jgi:hypothetical protein
MNIKPIKEEDAKKIIPQIRKLDTHTVWHDHTDETIGNMDLNGDKINIRRNVSAMILEIVRTGELLGLDLAPKKNISVEDYFDEAHNHIRNSISTPK